MIRVKDAVLGNLYYYVIGWIIRSFGKHTPDKPLNFSLFECL